ncbi:major facilitator superfamily domain-containing protein [Gloeopeniophorella convolvens]|nr:major facilitator superfamily domain-containing protein [Gloeopeniophorella convolvens]
MSGPRSLSPPRSRPPHRARTSQSPYPAINTVLPEGQVDDETAELLHEFVHSHTHTPVEEAPDAGFDTDSIDSVGVDQAALAAERSERAARPWWRRPSATWFIVLSPFSMLAVSALIAPRLQLFTDIVCRGLDAGHWDPAGDGAGDEFWATGGPRPVPCAADPVVQANVAKLLTIMSTAQGILSCLTTAFWGSFSDKYGRINFFRFNITALLLVDAALLALAVAPDRVPGGIWFLVYVSAFEGLLGGRSAGIAAVHAYLADCTEPAMRSRIFSRFLGLVFTGMAFGPSLGGIAERLSGSPYIIFYLALGSHCINAFFTWFVIPESLLPAQMEAARRAKRAESSRWYGKIFGFITPLAVFAPTAPEGGGATPQKAIKRDWSLTWMAFSYFPDSLILGGMQYWFQYASGKFGWTGEIVGYYISMIGITRALFLAVGLPAILSFFAPKTPPIHLPTEPSEPLDARSSSRAPAPSRGPVHTHTPAVDLRLAQFSLVLFGLCFALIAVSRSAAMFVFASALGALAGGYSPTIHSLSLELYTRRGGVASEAGRLFGAMSVLQALGNQIVGPSVFGLVYIKTVATYPEAIFYIFIACVAISLFFLFLVRIPSSLEAPEAVIVPTIVVNGGEEAEAPTRGRRASRTLPSDP